MTDVRIMYGSQTDLRTISLHIYCILSFIQNYKCKHCRLIVCIVLVKCHPLLESGLSGGGRVLRWGFLRHGAVTYVDDSF